MTQQEEITGRLLEVKTYKQPSGVVVQLRRFAEGCERMINGQWQERTYDGGTSKNQMVSWQNFEERIGSEAL